VIIGSVIPRVNPLVLLVLTSVPVDEALKAKSFDLLMVGPNEMDGSKLPFAIVSKAS
jgi:hypothetical protein